VRKRSNRIAAEDESEAKRIEAKAKFEVDALESAICALRGAILARSELVKEAEDSAPDAGESNNKLDGVVQTVLRKHGINVQRYWNGAVSLICLHYESIT
jgi:type II secretory pathway component PulM